MHQRDAQPELPRPGPKLVIKPGTTPSYAPERHSLLALWHLFSLDAPTVAALWTVFIARCAQVSLPWRSPAAMFVAVWMLYAADRLLDARPLPDGSAPPELEERHRFHQRYRTRFLTVIVLAAVLLVFLLHRVEAATLHLYTLLAELLGVWLLLIHARPLPAANSHRLPKELAVGLFFPAACFVPTIAQSPGLFRVLLPDAMVLAAVCTLNCLFIYVWEHPYPSVASAATQWAASRLTGIAVAIASIAVFIYLLSPVPTPAIACGLSVCFLLVLNARQKHMDPIHLRAAADLVLLTPLFFLHHIGLVH